MSSRSPSEPGLRLEEPAPGTWSLIAVLIAVHVLSGAWVSATMGVPLVEALVLPRSLRFRELVGGQSAAAIHAGEYWRLASSVLLHGDALHLGLNALAVGALGRILEPWVGGLRTVAWFAIGGLVGSALSQVAGVLQSDGASGGAFALLGAAFVLGVRHRADLPEDDRRLLGPVLGGLLILNLALSFAVPVIDAAGHVGGLVAGLALGWLPDGAAVRAGEGVLVVGFALACAVGWAGLG